MRNHIVFFKFSKAFLHFYMPASPVTKMRARANQAPKRLSKEEKDKIKEEREKKKTAIPKWLVWFMFFLLVGSTLVQTYFVLTSSPKLTEEEN
ncbi:hypothetical protein STCU_00139 [Strigomonas culicis]|uniref:Ribosome associated membrane protein RAMP4 n=1 Tax=Strigomonas culicis TaxID=28005 RepID=S9V8P3_9TRYP|nr:hypothetical protein STCU_03942 [Strigomonas culicis]EPY37158.1 hypothetical protein STCU_00139 [Strigomonas culicis]|eukprot:EPY30689.1 hypothetical protein STCU_03942 [Strigomonas culicis]